MGEYDEAKIDDAVLAILYLNRSADSFGLVSAWKSLPWDATDRLYEAGLISNPAKKAKSVVLSDEGLARAEDAARRMFGTPEPDGA